MYWIVLLFALLLFSARASGALLENRALRGLYSQEISTPADCSTFQEHTRVWVKRDMPSSGEEFAWTPCTVDLTLSGSLREDGYPSGETSVAVLCADESEPVILTYKDFIPGNRRRAIMDWEWMEKTTSSEILSCINDLRRDFPVAKSPDEEVYVFGIITYDNRIDRLGRRVRELALIAKQLPIKSKILVVYDGDRVRDVIEAACSSSDVNCDEGSDFLSVIDVHKLELNKLGIKYSLRSYAAAALGGTHLLQADDDDYWSADLVKEWVSAYHDLLLKEDKVVEIHALPRLARVENEDGSIMKFSGKIWDPKQGNPGVGLQTIAVQPPFGYISLGLEDQEHQLMMDAPDADTMMACQSDVGTGFCLDPADRDGVYAASCQYCQHHGISAETKMLVGVNLKRSSRGGDGGDGDFNLWNHKEERLVSLPASEETALSSKVTSWADLYKPAPREEPLSGEQVGRIAQRGAVLRQKVIWQAIRSVNLANALRFRFHEELVTLSPTSDKTKLYSPEISSEETDEWMKDYCSVDLYSGAATASSPPCVIYRVLHTYNEARRETSRGRLLSTCGNSGICTCARGEYNSLTNGAWDGACEVCPRNQTTPGEGENLFEHCQDEVPCGEGEYTPPNSMVCTQCPAGTYQSGTAVRYACSGTCSDDYLAHSTGLVYARDCMAPSDACTRGNYHEGDLCVPCLAEETTVGKGLHAYCYESDKCESGYYDEGIIDNGHCVACPRGRFADGNTPAGCKTCPVGKNTHSSGSVSEQDCVEDIVDSPCGMGQYAYGSPVQCQVCPLGKYQASAHSWHCDDCPEGFTSDSSRTSCPDPIHRFCLQGQYFDGDRQDCNDCPRGTYVDSAVGLINRCASCPFGTTTVGAASTHIANCSVALPLCQRGYRYDSTSNACLQCQSDSTTPGYGPYTECYPTKSCPAGQYDEGIIAGGNCASCPLGKWEEDDGARTACYDCSNQDYMRSSIYDYGDGDCEVIMLSCDAGYYSSFWRQLLPFVWSTPVCKPCPSGTYAEGTGKRASCTACNDGFTTNTIGAKEKAQCIEPVRVCAGGQYFGGSNGGDCYLCHRGKYASADGYRTICASCPPGKTTAKEGHRSVTECNICIQGYYGDGSSCERCPAGKYSDVEGLSACIDVPEGYYTVDSVGEALAPPYLGATTFRDCGTGKYSIFSVACLDCGSHETTASSASTNSSACVCVAGYHLDDNECVQCEPGTYKSTMGDGACMDCEAGKYSTAVGATSSDTCTGCTPGYFASDGTGNEVYSGASKQTPCTSGFYSSGGITIRCTEASSGHIATDGSGNGVDSAATAEEACAAGTFAPGVGLTSCTKCEAGKLASITALSVCSACNSGRYATGLGNSKCTQVRAGYIAVDDSEHPVDSGAQSELACGAGYYSTGGATECTLVGAGYFAADKSNTGVDSAATQQVLCASGFQSDAGATICFDAPSGQPTGQPTSLPSSGPTGQPTTQPTGQPSTTPSYQPTSVPTTQPTGQPSSLPSSGPTGQPTTQPTTTPTRAPISSAPTGRPTTQPTGQPSTTPSYQPTSVPTTQPTGQPSSLPSSGPTGQPTTQPTGKPTSVPTTQPTGQPSTTPSYQPTSVPTTQPTGQPSTTPSSSPSGVPTAQPSALPSTAPSGQPSGVPTAVPTSQPSMSPTSQPSCKPSGQPSGQPSASPLSSFPTGRPSSQPSGVPSGQPSSAPTRAPTGQPTAQPTSKPSGKPSGQPSSSPTVLPSALPSGQPTTVPSSQPTSSPSRAPSGQPSGVPSGSPTGQPTSAPSVQPSSQPSGTPTTQPSSQPSTVPTANPSTDVPTSQPTTQPSASPSSQPSGKPSAVPSSQPSGRPSGRPTSQPSASPTSQPTKQPTGQPTSEPSANPTSQPTKQPTGRPTSQPSTQPSAQPSGQPTQVPHSSAPTSQPSARPSSQPTSIPSKSPSGQPSAAPTASPTVQPTSEPSGQPTGGPTGQPTSEPSAQPSSQPSVPTSVPTARPSLSTGLRYISMYEAIVAMHAGLKDILDSVRSYTYAEMDYYNLRKAGTCTEWSELLSEAAAESFYYRPKALVFSSVNDVPPVYTADDLLVHDYGPYTATCTDSEALVTLTERLLTVTDSGSMSLTCNSRVWTIATCSAQGEDTGEGTAVCVDCTDPCDVATRCTHFNASTFALAPCNRGGCLDYVSDNGLRSNDKTQVLTLFVDESFPAPMPVEIVFVAASSPRTTLNISLLMDSSDGYVFCGTFVESAPSSVEEIVLQNNVAVIGLNNKRASVIVEGLSPATTYDVYCVGYHTYGTAGMLASVISGKKSATTACCKELMVSFPTSIYEMTDYYKFVKLTTGSTVNTDLVVMVNITEGSNVHTGSNSQGQLLLPRAFSLTESSTLGSSQYSNLRSATEGTYFINVTFSGSEAGKWEAIYLSGTELTLLSTTEPQPAPGLLSAQFSNDGTYITVTFEGDTNQGGLSRSFTCSDLFEVYEVASDAFVSIEAMSCSWQDHVSVIMIIGGSASVSPDAHEIHIVSDNDLSAYCDESMTNVCDSWPRVDTTSSSISGYSTVIVTAESPVTPSLSISAPSTIGSCDQLELDISGSAGSGGRSWLSVSITVTSTGSAYNTSLVQDYVNSVYVANKITKVPYNYLVAGLSYGFEVSLCNFFGKCASGTHQVAKMATIMPAVKIFGSSLRSGQYRSSSFSLMGQVTIEECDGSVSESNSTAITSQWRTYLNGVLQSNIESNSVNSNKYAISAYTFQTKHFYEVQFSGTLTENGVSRTSKSTVGVYVEPSDLVAVVAGGVDRNLPFNDTLIIDASESYDRDAQGDAGANTNLTFSWSCVQLVPMSEACSVTLMDQGQGVLSVFAGAGSGETVSEITMMVKDKQDSSRSKSKTVKVTVLNAYQPVVTLDSTTVRASTNDKVKPNHALRMQGTVSLVGTGQCVWTVNDNSLDLAEAAIVPTTKDIYTSGTKSLDFILQAYSLPAGSALAFTLTCTQYASAAVYGSGADDDTIDYSTYDDQIGTASMTVVINSPPTPGVFEVSPEYGTELVDTFTFSSSLWNDDDLPITYQYGFQSLTANHVNPVQSRSESTEGSASLPSGDANSGHALLCVSVVYDDMDANTTSTQFVYVNETSDPEGAGMDLISTLDSESSLDSVFGTVSATMSVVNKANCSLAPNCTSLHREKCSSVDHTCGECLQKFAGVLGSSNIACYSDEYGDASRRRLGGQPTRRRGLQSSCTGDDECEGFAVCTTTVNLGLSRSYCAIPDKTCPNDCSGHGICKFMEVSRTTRSSGIEVVACKASDFSCEAVCECDETYHGASCTVTDESLAARRALRDESISRLATIFHSSGVSESAEGITTALVALAEASYSSDEMTWNASQVLLSAAQDLVDAAIEGTFELTYDQITLVMDTVEKIAKTQERIKSEYLAALNSTSLTHLHQFVTLTAPSLMDNPSVFLGNDVRGSYTLMYNESESISITADASEADMYSAVVDMAPLATLIASSGGNLTLEVSRKRSATTVEDDGPVYSAVQAVPGNYYLTCPNEHTTCGFEKVPPGELIMLRDEVEGPYGDFHGRWYRVHSSHRPQFDWEVLPLAETGDYTVPTTYKGSVSVNTTILRWARGYTYHLHFAGSVVEVDNPWAVKALSVGSTSDLIPSPSSFDDDSEEVTTLAVSTGDAPVAMPNSTGLVQSQKLSRLIAACGELVASTMVSGQTPFQSVKAGMRITTTMVSSNEQTSSESTSEMALAQSDTEVALGSMGFTAAVPMKALDAGEDREDVAISVMSIDASLYEVPSEVASDVVFIEMSALPKYFDKAYSVSGPRRINITIPTSHKVSYAHPTLPSIYTYCGDDDWDTRTYSCRDIVMSDPACAAWENIDDYYDEAQFVSATCNGTIGTITSRCDMTYRAPICESLITGTGDSEGNSVTRSGCYMVSYDSETTTCSCPISTSSETRRRLASDNSTDGAVNFNYVALAESVGDTFVETWVSTSALDGDAMEDGWQVLATMTSLIMILIVTLCSVHRLDAKDRNKALEIDEKGPLIVKKGTVQSSLTSDGMREETVKASLGNLPTKSKSPKKSQKVADEQAMQEEIREQMSIQLYRRKEDKEHWKKVSEHVHSAKVVSGEHQEGMVLIEQALPEVLRSKPLVVRFVQEMKSYHRWFCIIWLYSDTFPRTLRVMSMFTNIVVILFIQALTYDLTNPDDGSCSTYETAEACLEEGSTFDTSVSKCTWTPKRYGGTCAFREPEDSLSIVIFVAIFSAMVSIPFLVSMEYMVKNVLAAKTRHSVAAQGSMYRDADEQEGTEGMMSDEVLTRKQRKQKARRIPAPGENELHHILSAYAANRVKARVDGPKPPAAAVDVAKRDTITDTSTGIVQTRQHRRASMIEMLASIGNVSRSSALTTTEQEDLGGIITGIRNHRRMLNNVEKAEFDDAWGIDATTTGFRRRSSLGGLMRRASGLRRGLESAAAANPGGQRRNVAGNRAWLTDMGHDDIQDRITTDLRDIRSSVELHHHDLTSQPGLAADAKKGRHLFMLFQKDLMPGVYGEILAAKSARDERKVVTTSALSKVWGWIFVILFNLTLLFYVYVFALGQSRARQGAWLKSFMYWLVSEIFITSTLVCIVTHLLVPSIIMRDLHKVKLRILNVLRDYREKVKKKEEEEKKKKEQQVGAHKRGDMKEEVEEDDDSGSFNAAKYFFVSVRLAEHFPHLKESKIIRQFKTPWPRVAYSHSKKDVKNSYNAFAASVGRSVALIVFDLIGHLVNLPCSVQDMLISAISTATVGYSMILHLKLYEWFPVLVVVPIGTIAVIVHFMVKKNDHDKKIQLAKTAPQYDEHQEREDRAERKADEDAFRRAELKGHEPDLHDPSVVLQDRVMLHLEKRRKNPFAHDADAPNVTIPVPTSPGDDSGPSERNNSSDGDSELDGQIKIRVKHDSLASIESADQFSDVSIASGHVHVISPAAVATSSPPSVGHQTRRQSVVIGMQTLQLLAQAQADPDFNPFKGKNNLKYESIDEKADSSSTSSSSSSSSSSSRRKEAFDVPIMDQNIAATVEGSAEAHAFPTSGQVQERPLPVRREIPVKRVVRLREEESRVALGYYDDLSEHSSSSGDLRMVVRGQGNKTANKPSGKPVPAPVAGAGLKAKMGGLRFGDALRKRENKARRLGQAQRARRAVRRDSNSSEDSKEPPSKADEKKPVRSGRSGKAKKMPGSPADGADPEKSHPPAGVGAGTRGSSAFRPKGMARVRMDEPLTPTKSSKPTAGQIAKAKGLLPEHAPSHLFASEASEQMRAIQGRMSAIEEQHASSELRRPEGSSRAPAAGGGRSRRITPPEEKLEAGLDSTRKQSQGSEKASLGKGPGGRSRGRPSKVVGVAAITSTEESSRYDGGIDLDTV